MLLIDLEQLVLLICYLNWFYFVTGRVYFRAVFQVFVITVMLSIGAGRCAKVCGPTRRRDCDAQGVDIEAPRGVGCGEGFEFFM